LVRILGYWGSPSILGRYKMNKKALREYFPIPLILFGGIMADISQDILPDIITIQIIAWMSVVVGGIGLARIVWNKVKQNKG